MRIIYLILIASCFLLTGCRHYSGAIILEDSTPPDALHWKGLKNEYTHFSQIKVELSNEGTGSIYLCRIYPQERLANLERFDSSKNEWKLGLNRLAACAEKGDPIEIKPGTRQEIIVDWMNAFSYIASRRDEKQFSSGKEKYPLTGQYRLTLKYAKSPWAAGQIPKEILEIKSPEFKVNWDENGLVKTDKGGC